MSVRSKVRSNPCRRSPWSLEWVVRTCALQELLTSAGGTVSRQEKRLQFCQSMSTSLHRLSATLQGWRRRAQEMEVIRSFAMKAPSFGGALKTGFAVRHVTSCHNSTAVKVARQFARLNKLTYEETVCYTATRDGVLMLRRAAYDLRSSQTRGLLMLVQKGFQRARSSLAT